MEDNYKSKPYPNLHYEKILMSEDEVEKLRFCCKEMDTNKRDVMMTGLNLVYEKIISDKPQS